MWVVVHLTDALLWPWQMVPDETRMATYLPDEQTQGVPDHPATVRGLGPLASVLPFMQVKVPAGCYAVAVRGVPPLCRASSMHLCLYSVVFTINVRVRLLGRHIVMMRSECTSRGSKSLGTKATRSICGCGRQFWTSAPPICYAQGVSRLETACTIG